MKDIVRQFLTSGVVPQSGHKDLATACDETIRAETQRSSNKALALARKFVTAARPYGGLLLTTALRAQGWVLLSGGKYKPAEKTYLEARSLVVRDPMTRGRIDRILIDVYMYLGDFNEARRRARLAMASFKTLRAHYELAKTRVNYGNLFHRQDRHREASRQYQKARKFLESREEGLVLALCYYNQANSLVQLFDFEQARSLYTKAELIFARRGFELYVNECRYGQAWVHMLTGDYHIALHELAECEAGFLKASQLRGVTLCQLDRAEAYLGLNLFSDARTAARDAGAQARRLGVQYESAKADFFLAKAAYAMGRIKEAQTALARAEKGFSIERNQGFLAATQILSVQIAQDKKISPAKLQKARKRFVNAQLPLWEAICDLQFLTRFPGDTDVLRRLNGNPAVKTVPHLYAHWQTVLGDNEAARGRMKKATDHWARAVEVLDAVRAKMPPVEMSSAFMRDRTDPYLRLIGSEAQDNPARAAVWSERYRTAGVWATGDRHDPSDPVRDRAARSLAELAGQVATIANRTGDPAGSRSVAIGRNKTLLTLQKKVRHNLAAIERSSQTGTARFDALLDDISKASCRQPIVQFHLDRDDLLAFIHQDRHSRTQRYVNGRHIVNEFHGLWRILLSRGMSSNGNHSAADLREEQRLFKDIGDWLWAPLEISLRQDRILVLPEGRLSNLPWPAIVHRKQPLVSRHSLVLSPSIRHYLHLADRQVPTGNIEVFVGRTDGLAHTQAEVSALANQDRCRLIVHDPCRRDDWPDNSEAWIWHYVGHAQLRRDNPFYSSLLLEDGPLFAADFRLRKNRVGLVSLAACRTGQQTSLPGEESTGLVRSFLEMGARNVVGSHWAISDKSAGIWMSSFYDKLFCEQSVTKAARDAALSVRESYPSAYHWAAFSVFGVG